MKFDEFLKEVALLEGIVWRKYRRHPARRSVEERLRELGLQGFEEYLDFLRGDPGELSGLADRMHITVTRFFRDSRCWTYLAQEVLPALAASAAESTLRAWSAGCCGGEEPYSLAMTWLALPHPPPVSSIEILASDIDKESLERARGACYEKPALREVPEPILTRFFAREKKRWCVSSAVKGLVSFERRNFMTDPLPAGMDLILCRYIPFTYYRGERLAAATARLWEALRPGGILMIGQKEQLPATSADLFAPLSGCGCFYRKR